MRVYQFRYLNGQSMPYTTISAKDDEEFSSKLAAWEKETGFRHIPSTMSWTSGVLPQK